MADLPRAEKPDEVTDKLINIPLLGFIFKRLRLMSNGRNDEATVREHIEELIEEVDDDSKQIGADQGELIVNILKLHELTAAYLFIGSNLIMSLALFT